MSIRIVVQVDAAAAARAGLAESGRHEVELSQADLDGLSPAQREALAQRLTRGEGLYGAVAPTVAEVGRLLRQEVERTEADQRAEAEQLAEFVADCAAVLAARKTWGSPPDLHIDWPYGGQAQDSPRQRHLAELAGQPEVQAWQAEIDVINEAQQRADAEEKAARAAQAAAKQRAAQEAEERYQLAAAEIVRSHGNANQGGRLEAGALPDEERDALVRDMVFAGLDGLDRYARLVRGDAPHAEDCDAEGADVEFDVHDQEELAAAQWDALQALRERAPEGAAITVRRHEAACAGDDCPIGVRWSLRVAVEWHGRTLSREYACPAGPLDGGSVAV